MKPLKMQSGRKLRSSQSKSPCLTLVYRRRSTLILACFMVIVFSFLLMNLSTSKGDPRYIYTGTTATVSEIRHVHECHCLVNVSLPSSKQDKIIHKHIGTNKLEDNRAGVQLQNHSIPKEPEPVEKVHEKRPENKQLVRPATYPVKKIKEDPSENKQIARAVPDPILRSITLKPNFTRLINATQRVTTINATYILENPTLCSSVQNLLIVAIVHSSPDHKVRRFAIRTTWANNGFYRQLGNVRILFLLGKTKDPSSNVQTDIENEFKRFGDILQGDFIDDYHNLTLKGVMAYKWLTERCRNANLILKVDDDISVDMFKLLIDYFPKYRSQNMTIVCNHILARTMGILRQNDSKWYVSNNHFRGLAGYPTDYCSGFFILFTNDLIPALYSSAKITPFFWVDDVYLYGLVPGNVPGVKYIGLTGNWHQLYGQVALKCYRNETATCPFLVAGAGAVGEFEELWPEMFKRYARTLNIGSNH